MSCPTHDELFSYVDRELSVSRHEAVTEHLAGCAACAEVESELRRIADRIGPEPDEWADVDLAARVGAVIDAEQAASAASAGGETAAAAAEASSPADELAARRRRRRRLVMVVAPALAAAAALLLVLLPQLRGGPTRGSGGASGVGGHDPRFRARGGADGGADKWVELWVFERLGGKRYRPVRRRLGPKARLVFGYRCTRAALRYLMIVGVDSRGKQRWYYPGSSAGEARSVTIQSGKHELPDEVVHDLPPGSLTLYALFSEAPLSARHVGGKLSGAAAGAKRLALGPGVAQRRLRLTVEAGGTGSGTGTASGGGSGSADKP